MNAVAVLHPGEMGAAIGACLVARGLRVVWASAGRGAATRSRAKAAAIEDLGTLAREVAGLGFRGVYVDANAISPESARKVGRAVEKAGASFVDGGIIGPPPVQGGRSRMYLSGARADEVAALFAGGNLHAVPLQAPPGAASALKACYAGWTKGATALLAAIRTLAEVEGVDAALLAEWKLSQPELQKRSEVVTVQARKAWRWIGEMEEIAASFEAAGLPGGFHRAAAEIYRKLQAFKDGAGPPALAQVTAAIRRKVPSVGRRKSIAQREKEEAPTRFKFGTAAVKRDAAKRLRSLKRTE